MWVDTKQGKMFLMPKWETENTIAKKQSLNRRTKVLKNGDIEIHAHLYHMTAKTRAEFLFKEQSFFGWLLFS